MGGNCPRPNVKLPLILTYFLTKITLLGVECRNANSAVQRSCRRRRRNARWSTTSWTPHSPNSPASKRQCYCTVTPPSSSILLLSLQLRRCCCLHQLPTTFVESLLSLSLTPHTTETTIGTASRQRHHRTLSSFIFYREEFLCFILLSMCGD